MDILINSIIWERLGETSLLFGGMLLILFLGSKWLPGPWHKSPKIEDGSTFQFKMNGFLLFLLATAALGGLHLGGYLSLRVFYTHFWAFFFVANMFAFALSFALYFQGNKKTGHFLKDYYYGADFNPTWFGVDLKMFSYRPSLLLLALFNVAFAVEQYARHGAISNGMWLYQGLYYFYIASSLQYEKGILSMWDIVAERFGWMLVWGDYVLFPFLYCLPGYFLIDRTAPLPLWALISLGLLFIFGFALFRTANMQKNRFKSNPAASIWGRPPEVLGGKLLVSGIWGIGRKLNYTGEILVYLAMTLACGFSQWQPYLLPLWMVVLLTHRAWRDEKRCRKKYGSLWEAYCRRARFRMIPFIY